MSHAKYVLIERAAELTGYSVKAINVKIDSGAWAFGEVWMLAPDGRRMVNMEGYQKWVEAGRVLSPAKRRSKSALQPMGSLAA